MLLTAAAHTPTVAPTAGRRRWLPPLHFSPQRLLAHLWRETLELQRDPMMLLIVYVFSVGAYTAATAMPETLQRPRSRSSMRMTRHCPSALSPPSTRRTSPRRS